MSPTAATRRCSGMTSSHKQQDTFLRRGRPYTPSVPLDPNGLGRADLHLHTLASDGLMSPRALVDYAEHATSLDVIAITDHDETRAALEGRDWAAQRGYRVQVVPGVEVTTRDGHLLALFIE